MSKKKKVRVELRKNREKPPRENDLTRDFAEGDGRADDAKSGERVRAKGKLSRYRTVMQDEAEPAGGSGMPGVNAQIEKRRRKEILALIVMTVPSLTLIGSRLHLIAVSWRSGR